MIVVVVASVNAFLHNLGCVGYILEFIENSINDTNDLIKNVVD